MEKTYHIVTLGCRTNQYETQAFRDQLECAGYREAKSDESAHLCIVNTCTVTASADAHSRRAVRQLIKAHPEAKVAVTGCYAENKPQEARSLGNNVVVISNKDKEKLLNIIYPEEQFKEFSIKKFEARTRAFVKVQDGCNSFCSYCIIPYVRGRSVSRKLEDIVREVKELVANGYKEIVLTGINIGDFDGHPEKGEQKITLADLVKAVDAIEGVQRLRLSSIDPDEVDDALMEAILHGKNTCHSLHIVLQAGSNVVLKRMNRKYTRQIFMDTIRKLRTRSPKFAFTTDVIVGFPGETDLDHKETLEIIEEVQFAHVHMFPYSARKRTKAALMKDQVDHAVKAQRKQEVIEVAERSALKLRSQILGTKARVLIEEVNDKYSFGHTDEFHPVYIKEKNLRCNALYEVVLTKNEPRGFLGTLCK